MTLPQPGERQEAAGFVLAGGESSRMGRDKALVELAGEPLIARALAILRDAGLQASIAGTWANVSALAPVVEDTTPGMGPLSGICAALGATLAHFGAFLPVDLPFLPSSLIVYMVDHARFEQAPVTIASVNGRPQTFPAVVEKRALPLLERQLKSEDRGTLAAFERVAEGLGQRLAVLPAELLVQSGQVANPLSLTPVLWFFNLNSPQDLQRARNIASGRIQVS